MTFFGAASGDGSSPSFFCVGSAPVAAVRLLRKSSSAPTRESKECPWNSPWETCPLHRNRPRSRFRTVNSPMSEARPLRISIPMTTRPSWMSPRNWNCTRRATSGCGSEWRILFRRMRPIWFARKSTSRPMKGTLPGSPRMRPISRSSRKNPRSCGSRPAARRSCSPSFRRKRASSRSAPRSNSSTTRISMASPSPRRRTSFPWW